MGNIGTYPTQNVYGGPIVLGYAELTTNQNGIGTTFVDVTNLTVTVTVPAGRRLKLTTHAITQQLVAAGNNILSINEGATMLNEGIIWNAIAGGYSTPDISTIITPSAGTHTYKVQARTTTNTMNLEAGPTFPAYLLVEDITGNELPVLPQSVPVGMIGQAIVTTPATQTYTTTVTDLTNYNVNVSVPAGRLLKVTAVTYPQSSVANDNIFIGLYMDGVRFDESRLTLPLANNPERFEHVGYISPSAGAHTFTVAGQRITGSGTITQNNGTLWPGTLTVEDITPTPAPGQGAPGSTLGYAEVTTPQSGIAAVTDLTGLSSTVTVPAGRRLRISVMGLAYSTVADDVAALEIKEGSTTYTIRQFILRPGGANGDLTVMAQVVLTPTAGTHTYKATLRRANGSGTLTFDAGASYPAFILVEDITGSVWPVGSTVTSGMIASEPFGTWTPVITQGATPTQTINRATFTKIGRLWIGFFHISLTSAGTSLNAIALSGFPVSASNLNFGGSFRYFDAGNTIRAGTVIGHTTGIAQFAYDGYGNNMGNGDFVIANGDLISGSIMIETVT